MCEQVSITGPLKCGPYVRQGGLLVSTVKGQSVCWGCDSTFEVDFTIAIPCKAARQSNETARLWLSDALRGIVSFHPMSHARFCEAVTENTLRQDLQALAGEVSLDEMEAVGHG